MQHILQRHHPKYWNGSVKNTQSFYDPSLSISTIRSILTNGIKNNTKTISSRLNSNSVKYKNGFSIDTHYKGLKYRIWFSKSGKVNTMYPMK